MTVTSGKRPDPVFKEEDWVASPNWPHDGGRVYVILSTEWIEEEKQYEYKIQLINGKERSSFKDQHKDQWVKVQ